MDQLCLVSCSLLAVSSLRIVAMFYSCLYTWSNTQGVLNWYLVHLQVGQRNVLFYTWKLKMIYLWESVTKMLKSVSLIQLWHLLPFACPSIPPSILHSSLHLSIPPSIHPTLQHWSLRFSYANNLLLRRTRESLSLKVCLLPPSPESSGGRRQGRK